MFYYRLLPFFAPKKKRVLTFIFASILTSITCKSQNLISNGGFESSGGYSSNYSLISAPTGNSVPGQYAITTNPRPINTANFMNSTDHSGTGNMMVVDGQNNDIFYKYTNLPIQRGLNYTFTYWIKNVNNVSNAANPAPKIDLTLSNQCPCTKILKEGNSDVGAMPAGWNKVSYTINVAGTGTAYIHFELSTNSAGGGGNDFAIDDISLYAPPAPLTVSTSVTNPSCPTGNDGVIVAYPNGGVGPFTFTLSGSSSATNTTGIFQNLAGGNYSVSITDSNSPASTVSTPVTLAAPLDITLSASPTGCLLSGAAVTLTAANGGSAYSWSASPGGPISGTSNSVTVNPIVTTTYTVNSTTVPPSVGNLIGNPGFENGTSGFYSDYGYSLSNTAGTQFAYGIVSNPSTWYNKFTTCGDKTTGTGKMLVADGATIANSVIWSQTVPVETSKSYNFSFWVQNIGDGSVATFQVLINGAPITLSSVSATNVVTAGTPATTTCNWTNITGTWNSTVSSLATIKIIDTNISGGGNDFAIDDLSFSTTSSKTCSLTTSTTVTIGGSAPVIGFSYTSPVCKNGINPSPIGVTGFVTGGTYSSTSGLSINASTGVIDLTASTAGTYTVTYTVTANPATCQLAGSSTATITINAQPNAGSSGNTTLCENSATSIDLFSLITGEQTGGTWTRTTGTGGTFNTALGIFTPAVGAITSTFTYTLNGTAPCSNSSSVATVNINPQPVAGSSGSTIACESSATPIDLFSLITGEQSGGIWTRTTGTGGTFNAALGTFTPAVGAITSSFTYTLNGTAPCSNSSSIATVNINSQPVAGSSGNTTVCENSATAIDLFSLITGEQSGGIWTRSSGTGGTFNAALGTFTPAVGATTSTFTYTLNGTLPCSNSSSIATVNINPQPVAGSSGNTTVCENSATSIDLFSLITGEQLGGIWTRSSGTGGAFNAALGTFTPAVGATTSTFTYTLNGTLPCGNSSSVATININPQPVAGSSGSTTACESSTSSINLFSLIAGEQTGGIWTRSTGTGGTFNATLGTFIPAIGATTSTFTYTLNGTSPCSNSSSVATININSRPVLSINCGTSTTSSVTFNWNNISGATGYTYNYSIDAATPVSGTTTGTTLTINNLIPGQNVAITVTSVGNTCITSGSGNCSSSNCPLPIVDSMADITSVCANELVVVPSFTSTPTGAVFNWASNNTSIGIAANGTGNIPSFTAINTTGVIQTAVISVTASDGTCTGPASTFKISINPLPIASISGTTSICSGTGTNITFSGTPNTIVTYTINSGVNQTINLDAAGTAILATGNLTVNTIYNLVSVQNPVTTCSQAQTGTVTVTINSLPTASISGSTSVCSGTGANITFSGTPNAIVTYTINSGTNQTINLDAAGTAILATGNLTTNTIYNLVSVQNPVTTCSQAQAGTATVTVNSLPTASISGSTSVCSGTGTNITFSGTPNTIVTYTINSGTNQTINLDAAGMAILATGNLTTNTIYNLVSVQNPATTCSQAQTGTATVTINSLPTASISGSTSVCSGTGSNITFSGTPNAIVTYTINSGTNQTINLDAAGTAILATGNLTTNTIYNLVSVQNPVTTCSQAQAGTATVTVNSLPVASISGSTSVCSGTGANITFSGTPNTIVTYTINSGTNQTINLDAAGTAILATGNLTTNTIYNLVSVQNPVTTCSQAQAGTATVTVNSLPTASISGTTTVCAGIGTTVNFTGTPEAEVTYKINSGANQTILLNSNGTASLVTGNLTTTTSYDLVSVRNTATNCFQIQTGNVLVKVNEIPIVVSTPSTETICSNQQTNILLTSSTAGTNFSWTVSQTGVTGAVAGSGNSISQLLKTTSDAMGAVVYKVFPTIDGCVGDPVDVTINVTPTPIAISNISSASICSGDTTSILLSSNLPGTTFVWNVVQTNVTGASAGNGNTIVQTLTCNGNNPGQVVYMVTPITNGCEGLPIAINFIVEPKPIVKANPDQNTICSGETTNVNLIAENIVGVTFNWTVVQNGASGASSGTGNIINQQLFATGSTQGTVTYTITPYKNGCSGIPLDVIVKVNPLPEVFGTPPGVICSGESPNISLSPSLAGTTFQWTVVVNGVSGASDGSGDVINQILETSGNNQGSVTYTITPTLNGCIGKSISIEVLVNPLPEPILKNGIICVDQKTGKAFKSYILDTGLSKTNYDFVWYLNSNKISGAVSNTYEATQEGEYAVIAINNSTGCVSHPVTANVDASFPGLELKTSQTLAFADDSVITITVTGGSATYEYQLDNGPFESSNEIHNVKPGPHIVTVRDINGCTDLSAEVYIIGYPKFFTPNGDGYNEYWNLIGLKDQPDSKIFIFDRYGKLLKQISSLEDGWDGTYNGSVMPASDYWFTVEYIEQSVKKVFRAHFALKR
ncbi:PKD-like domain-containing protein [Flavobacterium pectinovorum]|uniref:PKD-like domain-containing protein n=1 Tax=Flavobacterium pectinovorum TaxID=29533 RepID=UPI001FAE1A25|nr:PKD-like domain-containing protein [Flavobacterium pectinovorum]MCI9846458.1 T9SS type B sorting domain-containing protein [Flavobacterium pectinovorum]